MAAVALAGIIASVLNKTITRNVIRLTETAGELRRGNLEARAQITSADELGQLAGSINDMADRIKTLVVKLEKQAATAQSHLFQAIESISEGFSLYAADDRFVLGNSKYREICFVPTALGEASYREAKIWDSYRDFLVEGASQGGICSLPEVLRFASLEEFLEETRRRDGRILFDLADTAAAPPEKSREALILIGSERGWTGKEHREILDAGFQLRGLGRRILTTETACTAATALTLRELGLF